MTLDMLIAGAEVIDGTGAPRYKADVGVIGERIAFVGEGKGMRAAQTVDGSGCIVAPGFIDSHAHDDLAVLSWPELTAKTSQGVTTVVNGNCGNSLAPYRRGSMRPLPLRQVDEAFQFESFSDYVQAIESRPAAVNVASFIGHTALRACYVDDLSREAHPREIKAMRAATAAALSEGCLGLSTGTFYPPAAAATPEEIVAIGRDLAEAGGLYATHMRDEGDRIMEALDESAHIARELGVPLIVSHHKVMGKANFGRTAETLRRIGAMSREQPVCLDCYPYTASSSLLRLERLAMCEDIIVTSSRSLPGAAGQKLSVLAAQWECTREDAMRRVMPGTGIYFMMDEADVRRVLAYPASVIGSDGISMDDHPHPRLWGAFARVLGHYSREVQLFPLETAVHKMTGATARIYGLADRGEIKVGKAADLVVFDAARIAERATYAAPAEPAQGISNVFVNGRLVWDGRASTQARPGRFLRRGKPPA
jgi:N-acyl-D-amino-acid deacylase